MARRYRQPLTDRLIESISDFIEPGDAAKVVWDQRVTQLCIRIGPHKRTFIFSAEYQRRGKRGVYFRRLGFWPSMSVGDARKAALQHAAKAAEGRPLMGKREAVTVAAAMSAYVEHCRETGKSQLWAKWLTTAVQNHFGDLASFTLAELSDSPRLVKDWHRKISKRAKVTANRCADALTSAYRLAAKEDRSLPPAMPTSAVVRNKEEPAQTAMAFEMYPKWAEVVSKLPPLRQAYHRFLLFTSMRGGEAGRLRWSDIDLRSRSITLKGSKSGADLSFPMTSAIARCLKLARNHGKGDLIFVGAKGFWNDPLPVKGHGLRHSYRSVAADLGIDELHVRLLMGHSLSGISQSYVTRAVLHGGPGLKAAQRRVSKRIVELLGLKQ